MSKDREVLLRWDEYEIWAGQVAYLQKEEGLSEADAQTRASQDADLYSMEWDYLTNTLTEILKNLNPDSASWYAEVTSFGWRGLDGYSYFTAETGAGFLRQVLPDTECTFTIFADGPGLAIQNSHHDSPMGREWYHIYPDDRPFCAWCGDRIMGTPTPCAGGCGESLCDGCRGDDNLCPDCDCPVLMVEGLRDTTGQTFILGQVFTPGVTL